MRILVEEYGKVIVAGVISMMCIGVFIASLFDNYKENYPALIQGGASLENEIRGEPMIVAKPIEIECGSTDTNVDYTKYAVAYSDSSMKEVTPIIIRGNNVNVEKQGIYQVIFSAQNREGQVFSKRVPVLIY